MALSHPDRGRVAAHSSPRAVPAVPPAAGNPGSSTHFHRAEEPPNVRVEQHLRRSQHVHSKQEFASDINPVFQYQRNRPPLLVAREIGAHIDDPALVRVDDPGSGISEACSIERPQYKLPKLLIT